MVWIKFIGDIGFVAPTPEPIGGRLDGSAGSAEDEIVRSAQRLEQMVRNRIQRNPFRHVVFGARSSFRMIRVVQIRRLDISSDLKTQFWRIRLRLEYLDAVGICRPQPRGCLPEITNRGRQPHPPSRLGRHGVDAPKQARDMEPPRPLKKRMHLVDYDEVRRTQQALRVRRPTSEHRLDRFRRDQCNAIRPCQRLLLFRLGRVAMPFNDRDLHALAQLFQTAKLVVDECLERADVESREARLLAVGNRRHYRQECCFGLSGGRRRRDQDIAVSFENRDDRSRLNLAQFVPTLIADPTLNLRMQLMVGGIKSRCGGW